MTDDLSMRDGAGVLVLVVGPSGAGKDSLLAAARDAFPTGSGLIFARRVITRTAQADAEDHDSLDEAGFLDAQKRGAFMLAWQAHGLSYGIPAALLACLDRGQCVVANVSRAVIAEAEALPCRVVVINVTASPAILAERIARRGRETVVEIEARLKRESPMRLTGARYVEIRNETALEEAQTAFVSALRSFSQSGHDQARGIVPNDHPASPD